MTRRRLIGLMIVLVIVLAVTLAWGSGGGGTVCTLRCQGIEDDTAWDECMLKCHRGQR